jgi:hypothetical protein
MNTSAAGGQLQAEGVIQQQGLSSYMYGSHILTDPSGRTLYALTSNSPGLLDRFVGQRVRVSGTIVPGYPVDGGPFQLQVSQVTPS